MSTKDDIAIVLVEGAVVTALVGAGGIALPLAAAAYGVWRFGGIAEDVIAHVNKKRKGPPDV